MNLFAKSCITCNTKQNSKNLSNFQPFCLRNYYASMLSRAHFNILTVNRFLFNKNTLLNRKN